MQNVGQRQVQAFAVFEALSRLQKTQEIATYLQTAPLPPASFVPLAISFCRRLRHWNSLEGSALLKMSLKDSRSADSQDLMRAADAYCWSMPMDVGGVGSDVSVSVSVSRTSCTHNTAAAKSLPLHLPVPCPSSSLGV